VVPACAVQLYPSMSVVPSGANRRAASAAPSPNPNCASSSTRNPPAGHHGAGRQHVLAGVVVVAEPVPRQVHRIGAGVHELDPVARVPEVRLDLVDADHGGGDRGGRDGTRRGRPARRGDRVGGAAGEDHGGERADGGAQWRESDRLGTVRCLATGEGAAPLQPGASEPHNCTGPRHGEDGAGFGRVTIAGRAPAAGRTVRRWSGHEVLADPATASEGDERLPPTSEAMIYGAMSRLMLRRLTASPLAAAPVGV
jgi:hypothetical protein